VPNSAPCPLAAEWVHFSLRSFNRWEAGQKLFTRTLLANVAALQAGREMSVGSLLVEAVRRTLNDADADRSLKAYALGMPSLSTVAEEMSTIDPDALAKAYRFTQRGLALALRADLEAAYAANQLPVEPFRADQAAIGMRRLKNTCLNYLSSIEDKAVADLCLQQATQAGACMTDILAATSVLASCEGAAAVAREAAMSAFYDKHAKGNDLLICKWLRIQVISELYASSLGSTSL
jgi:aminopeptidase N